MTARDQLRDVLTNIRKCQRTGAHVDGRPLVAATRGIVCWAAARAGATPIAEDIHQELLAIIIKELNKPDADVPSIVNMISTIAVRITRRMLEKHHPEGLSEFDEEFHGSRAADPASLFEQFERFEPLNRALDDLKQKHPNHYLALIWYEQGYTDHEIVQRFKEIGVDPGTSVRTWRMRGKDFVKRSLGANP